VEENSEINQTLKDRFGLSVNETSAMYKKRDFGQVAMACVKSLMLYGDYLVMLTIDTDQTLKQFSVFWNFDDNDVWEFANIMNYNLANDSSQPTEKFFTPPNPRPNHPTNKPQSTKPESQIQTSIKDTQPTPGHFRRTKPDLHLRHVVHFPSKKIFPSPVQLYNPESPQRISKIRRPPNNWLNVPDQPSNKPYHWLHYRQHYY
jgi:hypothetical protein